MQTAVLSISFERSREKCRITIEEAILSRLPDRVFSNASSIAIISDDVVSKLYAGTVKNRLTKIAKTNLITFRHGENSKNLNTCSIIASRMSDLGLDRRSVVVALGGGVVGDIVGFVASIFKRGIEYVQVPTTLLAQVDSSIGGKTGVDTSWGKNQLGSFYQPKAIFIDPSTLDTLPQAEVINGLGEMIKSGIIADRNLFNSIEKIHSLSVDNLKHLIPQTCRIKARVVEQDERETNLRSILNYGHTVGHAIEAASEFKLSHGKCVILGMVAEGWIASKLGIFEESDLERQNELLRRIIKSSVVTGKLDKRKILAFAESDKKSSNSSIRMALPERIGKMHEMKNGSYLVPVSKELFLGSLQELAREL
jgi:3-dehydroquinate synthase